MGFFGSIGNLIGIDQHQDETDRKNFDNADQDAMRRRHEEMRAKLQGQLKNIKAPDALAPEAAGYTAKSYAGTNPTFDLARKRIDTQANIAGQKQSDAVARRFASLGGLGSGALVKQQELINQNVEAQKADALEGVNAQEAQDRRNFEQAEGQKEFASAEAIRGRSLQRDLYNSDRQFKLDVFKFDSQSKLAQLDLAFDQAEQDARNNEFNKETNEYDRQHSGGLWGSGGVLGLGIGA